jgi:hypothetical protein
VRAVYRYPASVSQQPWQNKHTGRKMLRLLLALAIALSQVHSCWASLVLPSGQTCNECPQFLSENRNGASALTSAANCLDCCGVISCTDSHSVPTRTSAIHAVYVADLPLQTEVNFLFEHCAPRVALIATEEHLANAPPDIQSTRAPPVSD